MDSNSESVWYGAPPAPETMSAPEPQHEDERHVRLRTDARYFLLLSLALGAVFALLFVNAYALGLNAALLAAAMTAATGFSRARKARPAGEKTGYFLVGLARTARPFDCVDRKLYDAERELSRHVHRRAALADERLCGYPLVALRARRFRRLPAHRADHHTPGRAVSPSGRAAPVAVRKLRRVSFSAS